MKEPEKILEAKDICKAYGKNMVLNQVNLTIKAGEIYGLVGENGAGKSSLMKVITGLTKPTSGEISLFGKKNLEDERNKIGCLIENPALYRYQKALVLKKGMVDIMRKFDRTNMKYNNPAGDLLTELEAADLTSNKVDSLASSGVVCTISVECGSIFTLACC